MAGIMYRQREIVLVPFPYSDLSSIKRRPVLIVSNDEYNSKYQDVVVVVISSKIRSDDNYSISLSNDDLEYGILPEESVIRVHKLFTIDKGRILKKFSIISETKYKDVYGILNRLFSYQLLR